MRIEKKARDLLIKDGYLVEKKNWNKFESPDFWGLFDIIALKNDEVRLIQIKSNKSGFYTARKEIHSWVNINSVKVSCEVWLYLGRNKWRIEVLEPISNEKTP